MSVPPAPVWMVDPVLTKWPATLVNANLASLEETVRLVSKVCLLLLILRLVLCYLYWACLCKVDIKINYMAYILKDIVEQPPDLV